MADNSSIEWTDATWNPIRARNIKTGKVGWHCEHATTGCEFCYAEGFNKRLGTGLAFKPGHRKDIEIFLDEEMLTQPLRWKKPRKIFVCSMTDLFADFVPDEFIDKMFAVMALAPQHTFQVLTKRAARMRKYFADVRCKAEIADQVLALIDRGLSDGSVPAKFPLPNAWLGVSAERQEEADERIPLLLQTPAAIRFISAEPLLGPMDLTVVRARYWALGQCMNTLNGTSNPSLTGMAPTTKLDLVISGGESGPKARLTQPKWHRELRDQCAGAGTAFFFKQWGEYLPVGQDLPGFGTVHGATAVKPGRMKLHYGGTSKQAPKHAFAEHGVRFASTADNRLTFRVGKKAAGRLLDGVEHNGFPARVTP